MSAFGSEESIAPGNIVQVCVSPDEIVRHMRRFQELKAKLLSREDVVTIQGKPCIKRSGWRKFALAFNLSDEINNAVKEALENDNYVWRIWVKCTAPNGRVSYGVGSCSTKERDFAHQEHDVYAIAHTRAKNRAISDLIGSGEVSAEEMDGLVSNSDLNQTQGEDSPIVQPDAAEVKEAAVSVVDKVYPNRLRWVIKGKQFPIPSDARQYVGLIKNRIVPGLKQKHGIDFIEELAGNHVTAIRTSRMPVEQYDDFSGALTWVLQQLSGCRKDDVEITVE